MYQIVYLSAASFYYDEPTLKAILQKSRENNDRHDITGLLLYNDGCIIQVLEGQKEDVLSVYEKINSDRRHKSVITLVQGDVAKRSFPDWSMGFKTLSNDEVRTITGYNSLSKSALLTDLEQSNDKEQRVVTLLRRFVQDNL